MEGGPKIPPRRELYPLRDIQEKQNTDVFEAARSADAELKKLHSYIGLAPFGSMTSDYATEYSDIDMLFILNQDDPNAAIEDAQLWPPSGSLIVTLEAAIRQQTGRSIHLQSREFSLKQFQETITNIGAKEIRGQKSWPVSIFQKYESKATLPIEYMSRVMKGEKVENIREDMKNTLQSLPQEERSALLDAVADNMGATDGKSVWTRLRRKTEHDRPEIWARGEGKEYIEERKKLWRDRLEVLWN